MAREDTEKVCGYYCGITGGTGFGALWDTLSGEGFINMLPIAEGN